MRGTGRQPLSPPQLTVIQSAISVPIRLPALGYCGSVESDAELARQHLELVRATSSRLWTEYRTFAETLDPARGVAGPEELRRLGEASELTGKIYAAEHALFTAENGTPGIVGAHGEYQWLIMLDCDISTLLRLCPDVVLNKYLAVTSIDSGTLQLNDQENRDGWWTSVEFSENADQSAESSWCFIRGYFAAKF